MFSCARRCSGSATTVFVSSSLPYSLAGSDALLCENFPFGCCVDGSGTNDVPRTAYPILGVTVFPGTFSLSQASSWNCNDPGCSLLFACCYDLDHSSLVFYPHTNYLIPVGVIPPSRTIRLPIVARFGAQYVEPVPPVDLTNYTHINP